MTTEEGNKLIAEFEDMILHTDDPEYGEVFYHKGDKHKINRYPIHELKYHTSWDWLMPVIDKIESLVNDKTGHISVIIQGSGCEIVQYDYKKIAASFDRTVPKVQNVYQCVVKFINWYNSLINQK